MLSVTEAQSPRGVTRAAARRPTDRPRAHPRAKPTHGPRAQAAPRREQAGAAGRHGPVRARAGRPVQGWLTCALTGLIVPPVSWDHHWVRVAPALAVLADAAVRAARRR